MADQGVVIGWHRIVGDLVDQGTLVRFTDLVIDSPGGYYLTWNTGHQLSLAALVLRDWLRSAATVTRASLRPLATVE